jgi:hypothetical protein
MQCQHDHKENKEGKRIEEQALLRTQGFLMSPRNSRMGFCLLKGAVYEKT